MLNFVLLLDEYDLPIQNVFLWEYSSTSPRLVMVEPLLMQWNAPVHDCSLFSPNYRTQFCTLLNVLRTYGININISHENSLTGIYMLFFFFTGNVSSDVHYEPFDQPLFLELYLSSLSIHIRTLWECTSEIKRFRSYLVGNFLSVISSKSHNLLIKVWYKGFNLFIVTYDTRISLNGFDQNRIYILSGH